MKDNRGFTLFEVLVVVIILGVLAAIAAPSWLNFLNRQRVQTAQSKIYQALQNTQSYAKLKKLDGVLTFDLSTNSYQQPESSMREIGDNVVIESITDGTGNNLTDITFDYEGTINDVDLPITVRLTDTNNLNFYCVEVRTLLGALRKFECN